MAALVILAVAALVLGAAGPAATQQEPRPEVIARNLAENVLGRDTVRWVRVSADRRRIDIGWDTALYRKSNTRAQNREQVRGEAELATGSIMGVMRPQVISFSILLDRRRIASGRRTPDGFTITYAQELGG